MTRLPLWFSVPGLAVIAAATLAAGAAGQAPTPPAGGPAAVRERTIVVTGEGSVDAAPDRATVDLSIVVLRPTAQEALQQTAATMARIVEQIVSAGIPQTAIRTTAVSLYPQRKPDTGGQGPITGYQATNRVIVTIDDTSRVGQVIDRGVAAGANGVDSLIWSIRDVTPYRTQALRMAVDNARATANAIAAAAGVGPLRLLRIEQGGLVVYPRPGLAMSQAAPSTPALPGTIPVSVVVRAVYGF